MNLKKNILILSAGRRVELLEAFQNEVRTRGLPSRLLATDLRPDLSAACQIADEAIAVPRVTDPAYMEILLDLCLKYEVGLVVPTIDTELLDLARNRAHFSDYGIHIVISDESLIRICRDKRKTARFFSSLGMGTPKIYEKTTLTFPCFVKPYDGSRSVGAALINSQNSVTSTMLADPKLMFMEFIDGSYQEYTVDTYYNRTGQLKCLVPRQRLEVRDGEVSKGITRRGELYSYLQERISRVRGARGCLTWQIFASESFDRYAAIEINPRFGGGYPLAYASGAAYPGWLIDEYILDREVNLFEGWEDNLMMLRYDAKILVHNA